MDTLQIQIPEGHEVDTFDPKTGLITFKKKIVERWINNPNRTVSGYYISTGGQIMECGKFPADSKNIFATGKQALSALAMAQLSQIIYNDSRFGGPISDNEWKKEKTKYIIERSREGISTNNYTYKYHFLAFHTSEQRDLFLKENEDLIKQYFML